MPMGSLSAVLHGEIFVFLISFVKFVSAYSLIVTLMLPSCCNCACEYHCFALFLW
uniref:Uncharacterized protein n=1 Tax=Arundo donax TaxID=35708 RepID=A0A0A9HE03_ARUDO